MDYTQLDQKILHPKDRNSFLSNVFFFYTFELYKRGFKKDLEEGDLYSVLLDYKSKTLGSQMEAEWEKQRKSRKNTSIIHLLFSCYGFWYMILGLMELFINIMEMIIHPFALGKLVSYFSPSQNELTKADAWFYAVVLIGFNFFYRLYLNNYYMALGGFGFKIRAAICSFIYRKTLKLSPAHLNSISIGNIVTMITKDVEAFQNFAYFGNSIWISLVKTIVALYILYIKIGVAAFAAVAFFLVVMPLQIYLGIKMTSLRTTMCKHSDKRLQITQEIISAIRIVKMYTWEKVFENKVSINRKKEINTNFKMYNLRMLILIIGGLSSDIGFFIMFATYIWLGNTVKAEIVYYILSIFHTMYHGLQYSFPTGVYLTAELKSAIERVGKLLKAIELPRETAISNNINAQPSIIFKNVSVSIKDQKILKNISLSLESGLTLLTGPVGSGKSILLKTILQDYVPEEGDITIQGQISYASQDPWLFPSSIRQNILFGEKYDEKRYQEVLKVCALIYDFELLENGDSTIIEDRGINLSKGQQARISLARAVYRNSDIYLLDDSLASLDAHVSGYVFKECILSFLKDKLVVLVAHNMSYIQNVTKIITLKDGVSCELPVNEVLPKDACDSIHEQNAENEDSKLISNTSTNTSVYKEIKQCGKVDPNVYKIFIKHGGCFTVLLVLCLFAIGQFVTSFKSKLISKCFMLSVPKEVNFKNIQHLVIIKVNLEEQIFNNSELSVNSQTNQEVFPQERANMIYLYVALVAAMMLTSFASTFSLYLFIRNAAINLHKNMISSVINATLEFFDTNFVGNILNRFSKDLAAIDDRITIDLYYLIKISFVLIGIITLIASVNATFLVPSAILFIIALVLRRCCVPATRSLKRLEALTKSPVIGHLNATLEGLTTVRAFKTQKILIDEFDRHQDLYTSASFIYLSSMEAFSFVLDSLGVLFIAIIATRFLISDKDTLAGDVGLALSQAFTLASNLQWGTRQWTALETHMTSIERILEYTDIKQESKTGSVHENWPKDGEIKYENVYLKYTNINEPVLKNINFTVQPKEQIGIVGRTGAGKSSIISSLFRLYEVEGKISIDGVNAKTLFSNFLRSKISIIPQDPILFSGTFRENIDPTYACTDEEIWNVVEAVHLKSLLPSLDFEISGSNFSIGQRQLICVARAIIQKNKIIVLDEATANMDSETEALIYQTIKQHFSNCTQFVIAHKLHSVLNSDKVMVLDQGRIVEYDTPENLLKNKSGYFWKMMAKS